MTSPFVRFALFSMVLVALLPAVVALTSDHLGGQLDLGVLTLIHLASLSGPALALGCAAIIACRRFERRLESVFVEQGRWLDSIPLQYVDISICCTAGVSLFLELAMIRWLGSVYPFFAFYKNLTMLACFLGLGLGYAMGDRDEVWLPAVLPLLLWEIVLLLFIRYGMDPEDSIMVTELVPFSEQLHMGLLGSLNRLFFFSSHLFLASIFMLTSAVFIPIGQTCARLLRRRGNLKAYGLNLLGSVLGVCLMFLTSYLWLSPEAWFVMGCGLIVIWQLNNKAVAVIGILCTVTVGMVLAYPLVPEAHRIHSPYQVLERTSHPMGWMYLEAAGHYFQRVFDLSRKNANREIDPTLAKWANYYELPYRLHPAPEAVAVVGAGCGNDVAAAKRMGAKTVDAVEIDPVILLLGAKNHPERPYAAEGVTPIVNDARAFFRTTENRYDAVVFGLLDSHTIIGNAASVRLDSFVYTVEGLREARSRLKDNGLIALSFYVPDKALGRKLFVMLQQAFDGREPVCILTGVGKIVTFLQGRDGRPDVSPELLEKMRFKDVTALYADQSVNADVSTDDWPFVYMPERRFPSSYVPMGVMVVLGSLLLIRWLLRTQVSLYVSNLEFLLLGAGFMLVETKAITELGLTFGNSWHVVGIAVAGILAMAFFANAVVSAFNLTAVTPSYVLLSIALGVGYYVSAWGGFSPTVPGKVATVVVLTLPVFFSGIIFSALLARGGNIAMIMSANLLGAMCGGLLEYSSIFFGFKFLYLLAIGIYAVSFAWGFFGAARKVSLAT